MMQSFQHVRLPHKAVALILTLAPFPVEQFQRNVLLPAIRRASQVYAAKSSISDMTNNLIIANVEFSLLHRRVPHRQSLILLPDGIESARCTITPGKISFPPRPE